MRRVFKHASSVADWLQLYVAYMAILWNCRLPWIQRVAAAYWGILCNCATVANIALGIFCSCSSHQVYVQVYCENSSLHWLGTQFICSLHLAYCAAAAYI